MGDVTRGTAALPGRVLAGKYRLLEVLGRGGMGAVWKAEHLTLMSPVAVKLIEPPSSGGSDASIARFAREAQAAAVVRSPHVVQVLDHGIDDGAHYIVMELLEGETLRQRLQREKVLSSEATYRLLLHVGRALTRAHDAGIVHRDLKPENIFIVRNGDDEVVKVLDFGVAKRTSTQVATLGGEVTHSGVMLGTPSYMSPEQAWGTRDVDARSDLWTMGVIAYECLCGKRAFDGGAMGATILQICTAPLPVPSESGGVPSGFDAWFERALAREPSERFQSARDLVDAARPVLAPAAARETFTDGGGDPGRPEAPAAPSEEAETVQGPAVAETRSVVIASGARRSFRWRTIGILGLAVAACVGIAAALHARSDPSSATRATRDERLEAPAAPAWQVPPALPTVGDGADAMQVEPAAPALPTAAPRPPRSPSRSAPRRALPAAAPPQTAGGPAATAAPSPRKARVDLGI